MTRFTLRPFSGPLACLLLLALAAGCADTLPAPQETESYDAQAGPLTSQVVKALAFGSAATQTAKKDQALVWVWSALAKGTFSVKVSNWKKAWMVAKLQRLQASGVWQTVQVQGGAASCLLGVTPASPGQYRLVVTGATAGVGVTASLACTKGVCAPPSCPASPQLAAQAAASQVTKNVLPWAQGVTWMSESDYPFDAVGLVGTVAGTPTPTELLNALGLSAATQTEVWPADKLYASLVDQGMKSDAIGDLRQAVEAQGTAWTVIRVGKAQVQLYLVGRSPCGALIGLHTVSIET